MSFFVQAPYPGIKTTTILPNPQLGDSLNSTGTVEIKRSMNGNKFSFIKSRDSRKRLLFNFVLSHHKALELRAFFDAYNSAQIQITNYEGSVYIGYFTINPFEFEALSRSIDSPGSSRHQIQLEFEGFLQS